MVPRAARAGARALARAAHRRLAAWTRRRGRARPRRRPRLLRAGVREPAPDRAREPLPGVAHVGARVRAPGRAGARGSPAALLERRRGRDARARLRARAALDARGRARRALLRGARAGSATGAREWHPWVGLEIVGYVAGPAVRVCSARSATRATRSRCSRSARSWSRAATTSAIETWRRWREPAEAAGMTFAAAPEYQVFPTPRAAAEALRGGGRWRRARRGRSCARSRPTSRSRTSSRPRPRWPPSSRACRSRRSSRTCTRTCRPASRRSRSARGCRARGLGRGALAPHRPRWSRSGSSRAARVQRLPRAARAGAAAVGAHRALALADDGRRRCPQLEYPRAWPPWLRVVGPLLWEPGRAGAWRRRRATGPVVLSRRRPRRTRRTALLRAALDGLADEPVRVIATNGREPDAIDGAGQRRARAVDVLRADDAALRPRGHATAATGRSCARWPAAARSSSARRAATWPRTPRASTGRASACGCRGGCSGRGPCAWRSGVRCAMRGMRARARAVAAWVAAHDGADAAARELEALV